MTQRQRVRIDWRTRLLYALIVLLLFFGGASLVLRVMEKRKLVQTQRLDDRVMYRPIDLVREAKTTAGAPALMFDDPMMLAEPFAKEKPAGTQRIFLTGESFMLGWPYIYSNHPCIGHGDITNWLRALTKTRLPAQQLEFINAAAGAQVSGRVKTIVERLVTLEPDLLIAAIGNNEGVMPATAFNETMHQWVIYRLLKKTLLPEPKLNERPYLSLQDASIANIESTFRKNIKEIIALAKEKNVRLVLCTLPINLRFENPREKMHDEDILRGRELQEAGKYEEAIAVFGQSKAQGWAAKYIGDCLLAQKKFDAARTMYKMAVQLNPQNRTRPTYNEAIREFCRMENLVLVDLEKMVEAKSPHGIPDPELFFDSCHMKWQGYYLVAEEIFRVLLEKGLIRVGPGEPLPALTTDELKQKFEWMDL